MACFIFYHTCMIVRYFLACHTPPKCLGWSRLFCLAMKRRGDVRCRHNSCYVSDKFRPCKKDNPVTCHIAMVDFRCRHNSSCVSDKFRPCKKDNPVTCHIATVGDVTIGKWRTGGALD